MAGRPSDPGDVLVIRPLGAGQEVGRSCHILKFKGKTIMLDCGIHPGLKGLEATPYTDLIEAETIDLLLISHFHLDHCGALPWYLAKSGFKGRVFMTHPTKAIYRWLLSDYVKVSNISSENMLYLDSDIEASMQRIETVDFHQEVVAEGIKFCCYQAGHVLGAAMFLVEIAGVKVLYTGDFSCQEDRHLMAAEIPDCKPDILITEATYGTNIHEKREDRESRFTGLVQEIVTRGGRCLIPVFALGRAQELLLILDEYWGQHPELQEIPIYYASSLAKKCMAVYQTYVNAMNAQIRRQIAVSNPFNFKHISYLKGIDHFEDSGPAVVMASPGMMQSGLSRELFEGWCSDPANGTIIAGYCVEGTLAKKILSEPSEIEAMDGRAVPRNCSVNYISFSAHTDYEQTSAFIKALAPPHVVLVHGEANEMGRLKAALLREYEDRGEDIHVYNPRNAEEVTLHFRGEKMAKVVGSLAAEKPQEGKLLSGILVKKNFNYHLMCPADLPNYTDLVTSRVTQRQSVTYTGYPSHLMTILSQLGGTVVQLPTSTASQHPSYLIFNEIKVSLEGFMAILEWESSPLGDVYADAVLASLLNAERAPIPPDSVLPTLIKVDKAHFKECVYDMLGEMFGKENVGQLIKGDCLRLTVGGVEATVHMDTLTVTCEEDSLQQAITTAVTNLHQAITPTGSTPNV